MKCEICKKEYKKKELRVYALKLICDNCFKKELSKVNEDFRKKVLPKMIEATNKTLK
jgi:hypothetical protein